MLKLYTFGMCKSMEQVIEDKNYIYNLATGEIFKKNIVKLNGSICNYGYAQIGMSGTTYKIHRLIYEMGYSVKLKQSQRIQHINGDKTDNRLSNLRLVEREGKMKGISVMENVICEFK